MPGIRPSILISLAFVVFTALHAADAPIKTAPVQTASGPVIGEERNGVHIFRGIPYAAPPVGDLRWKYTRPVDAWKEPRECLAFGPVCPQPTVPLYGDLGPASENCLFLNVWSAAKVTADGKIADEKRPVLFWIHGGGFAIGAASQTWYEGTPLALDGAVVVSFNYRLGPFGFLAHPGLSAEAATHASGNYGMMDMASALQWVKSNIAFFGGDPNNVTIWGESAGGAAVDALMASPLAKGLFHRAISMSSNTIVEQRFLSKANGELQSMEELGVEFQKRLNVPDGPDALKEMRAKTPAEIIKAGRPGSAVPGVSTTDSVIVDGAFLEDPIKTIFAEGKVARVPMMFGNVADEGSMFERKLKYESVVKYKEFLDKRYGTKSAQAFDIYPTADDAGVQTAQALLFSDIFVATTRLHARQMAAVQPATYQYHFTRKAKPMVDSKWGVYHGSELPFFFGNVQDTEKYTDEDRELSRLIRLYLVTFAKTGNPNPELAPQAPNWPAFKLGEEQLLVLDTPISTGEKLHGKTLDALEKMGK